MERIEEWTSTLKLIVNNTKGGNAMIIRNLIEDEKKLYDILSTIHESSDSLIRKVCFSVILLLLLTWRKNSNNKKLPDIFMSYSTLEDDFLIFSRHHSISPGSHLSLVKANLSSMHGGLDKILFIPHKYLNENKIFWVTEDMIMKSVEGEDWKALVDPFHCHFYVMLPKGYSKFSDFGRSSNNSQNRSPSNRKILKTVVHREGAVFARKPSLKKKGISHTVTQQESVFKRKMQIMEGLNLGENRSELSSLEGSIEELGNPNPNSTPASRSKYRKLGSKTQITFMKGEEMDLKLSAIISDEYKSTAPSDLTFYCPPELTEELISPSDAVGARVQKYSLLVKASLPTS